jgi:signal transduction histidine kinase/DNA-binding NarL/FixJ family response regulator
MKYVSYFILIFVFFSLYNCDNSASQKRPPQAENGVLDLRDWNFAADGPVELKGEWKFKWMEDSTDFIRPEYDDSAWKNYPVPSGWANFGKKKFGYGWFRLKVLLTPAKDLGIYLYGTRTSYMLYANDELILQNGKPGNNALTTIPDQRPLIHFLPGTNSLVLAWKIANFHEAHTGGGPYFNPVIGLLSELKADLWHTDFYNTLVLGIILMMALYHVLLWLGRREDKSSILFALFCLLIFLRMLGTNAFMHRLFSHPLLYHIRIKMEFLAISLGWTVFITFLSRIFPAEFKNALLKIFQAAGIVLSLFIIVAPIALSTAILVYIEILLLIIVGWVVSSVIIAVLRKRSEAGIVLCGLLFLFVSIVNDILFSYMIIKTSYLFQIGLVVFIFCMSGVLSTRFAKAYRTANHLSLNLQEEVKEQTKIITKKNKELVRLNREKTDYFVNLAHETKTPLTLILNYLRKYTAKKGTDPDLSVINRNLEKLKQNMINFLDYEKLEKGQDFYDHSRVTDISRTLENSIKLFKEAAAQKQIEINMDIREGLCISADPYAVDRIINNLLDNALKYTETNGEIDVRLQTHQNEVKLVVKDSGIGISEEQLKNIFKSYYQISHEKRNIQGIGMGLNIVKKILDDVGGRIKVASSLGKGSEFKVYFKKVSCVEKQAVKAGPQTSEYNVHAAEEKGMPVGSTPGDGRYTLLVVEDNSDMLAYLCDTLAEKYNVCAAQNGKQALLKLETMPRVHLIVSDIMMDVMDGYEFYEELQKNNKYSGLPVIFLTAKNTQQEKIKAIKKGAVDFIHKPFDIEEVQARINSIIKITESQFEKSKREVIQHVVAFSQSKKSESDFSLQFEQICGDFDLSDKEKKIVYLLLEGKLNKEIAHILGISIHTVKSHASNIYRKCGVQNKIELMNLFRLK